MIPSSRKLALLVLTVSAGGHLAAMGLTLRPADVAMQGGAEVAASAIGSSFADLSAGMQTPQPVALSETVQPVEPVTARTPPPAVTPTVTAQATPSAAPQPLTATPAQAATPPVPTLAPTVPAPTETAKVEPQKTEALPPPETVRPEPERTAEVPPEETVTPEPEPTQVVENSPRPKARPKPPAPAPAPGNADRNARSGSETGAETVKTRAAQSQKAAAGNAAGNAAADNYPGQVMRRISRVPRPRVQVRGEAVIRFSIAANGALAAASVARSSGSAALDSAALAVLQKAAPFPAPPAGARRDYSIRIEGR